MLVLEPATTRPRVGPRALACRNVGLVLALAFVRVRRVHHSSPALVKVCRFAHAHSGQCAVCLRAQCT
eukprot:10774903-Alexandrium_andersonii.AAC.1